MFQLRGTYHSPRSIFGDKFIKQNIKKRTFPFFFFFFFGALKHRSQWLKIIIIIEGGEGGKIFSYICVWLRIIPGELCSSSSPIIKQAHSERIRRVSMKAKISFPNFKVSTAEAHTYQLLFTQGQVSEEETAVLYPLHTMATLFLKSCLNTQGSDY